MNNCKQSPVRKELEFEISNLEIKIDEMRAESRNPVVVGRLWQRIEDLKQQYFEKTGQTWDDKIYSN